MNADRLRVHWWRKQGFGPLRRKRTPASVLADHGWMRSVGGCGPYLGLHARAGFSREAIDAALARGEIHELPAVRGCTYVVPAEDYALALWAGQPRGDDPEITRAKGACGVTDQELDVLSRGVLDLVAKDALDPQALKEQLGDRVRSLGEAGKKIGLTTTLPLVLGRLQYQGLLRRVPTNGRLDQQRYRYASWSPSPLMKPRPPQEVIVRELMRRYFEWTGPATLAQFRWWSDANAQDTNAAVAALGLVDCGDDLLATKADAEELKGKKVVVDPAVAFVASLDNLAHLRRETASLTKVKQRVLTDLPHHAIFDRGELIGFWDYDPTAQAIRWQTFGKPQAGVKGALAEAEAFVRDQLGDARAFSLDSPESRGARLAALTSS